MPKLKIFIAGHKGMVGSAIFRQLKDQEVEIITKNREELNLLNQQDVQNFFKNEKIDQVYLAAAKVGGIHANNTYPADFIYQNLTIQNNIIHSAFLNGVKKLLFLGSSCIYPKNTNQPMKEEELLSGKLEPTNEPYAIAKIAGIKICESYNRQYSESHGIDYRSIMPTNLYGPGDNYHPENSHVIPGLINRFHCAKVKNLKSVTVWGTGAPRREFLYVDDMAKASIYIMNINKEVYDNYTLPMCSHINVGSGTDLTIKELAETIKEIVGFKGEINFDLSRPDGINRKLLDIKKLNDIGFKSKINLKEGLIKTYQDFISTHNRYIKLEI
ncbi:GDP-L-fucose synthase [Candidatus Pelagibacter ubique]|nr:GDP-L-fucose synthase [Candidatus Pelagibacter ubique]